MQNMKLYKNLEPLIAGSMVRLDSPLFSAVMNEAVKAGIPSYANFVRAILAATCLDKTYGDITPPQGQLVAGNTYYTESDIQGYESQIETLKVGCQSMPMNLISEMSDFNIWQNNIKEKWQFWKLRFHRM